MTVLWCGSNSRRKQGLSVYVFVCSVSVYQVWTFHAVILCFLEGWWSFIHLIHEGTKTKQESSDAGKAIKIQVSTTCSDRKTSCEIWTYFLILKKRTSEGMLIKKTKSGKASWSQVHCPCLSMSKNSSLGKDTLAFLIPQQELLN